VHTGSDCRSGWIGNMIKNLCCQPLELSGSTENDLAAFSVFPGSFILRTGGKRRMWVGLPWIIRLFLLEFRRVNPIFYGQSVRDGL
jgi:hypothetical protein